MKDKKRRVTVRIKVEKGSRRLTIDREVGQQMGSAVYEVYDSTEFCFSKLTKEQVLKEIAAML